ncbi:MAG: adenylyltransferase/cytidyltransferase family protein [Candidatus Bathyarchaeota archaeon]
MTKKLKIRVAVAGGFDPLHIGHLRHLQAAKALGDHLIVLVSNDDDMIRKKGYYFMSLKERIEILKALSCVDEVIPTIDEDGTQAKTLRMVKPDIFAKGGDRTPDNMPENEIKACEEIGCKIVYGVGEQLASSSELLQKAAEQIVRSKTNVLGTKQSATCLLREDKVGKNKK